MHATSPAPITPAIIEQSAASLVARMGPRGGVEFDLAPQAQMRATVTRDPITGGRCWRTTFFRPGHDPEHRCKPSAYDAVRELLQAYPSARLVRAIDQPRSAQVAASTTPTAAPAQDSLVWHWRRSLRSFSPSQRDEVELAMRAAGASPETAELWSTDAPGMRQRNEIHLRNGSRIPFAFTPWW